jgi:hypothetical protein
MRCAWTRSSPQTGWPDRRMMEEGGHHRGTHGGKKDGVELASGSLWGTAAGFEDGMHGDSPRHTRCDGV